MNVCIIPAKGTSTRIQNKNIREFCGKPIIAYSIEVAKASGLFERVIVSTEDDNVAEVAQRWGADILMRPRALAECDGYPDYGTQEVTRNALEAIKWGGIYAACIYPCSPLLYASDLTLAYEKLKKKLSGFVWADGAFYFGTTEMFMNRAPLTGFRMDSIRYVDINVESDWKLAEQIYKEMNGIQDDINTLRA